MGQIKNILSLKIIKSKNVEQDQNLQVLIRKKYNTSAEKFIYSIMSDILLFSIFFFLGQYQARVLLAFAEKA